MMDRRIIKTKHALFTALSTLLKEKKLQDITITDLAKTAGINRKTFYNHYSCVKDVLEDLEFQIIESLIEQFEENRQQGFYKDTFHTMFFLCQIIEKDYAYWNGLLHYNGFYQDFLCKSQRLLKPVTIAILEKEYPEATGTMMELAVDYIMSGIIGILARWLITPGQYQASEIAEAITLLALNSCKALDSKSNL